MNTSCPSAGIAGFAADVFRSGRYIVELPTAGLRTHWIVVLHPGHSLASGQYGWCRGNIWRHKVKWWWTTRRWESENYTNSHRLSEHDSNKKKSFHYLLNARCQLRTSCRRPWALMVKGTLNHLDRSIKEQLWLPPLPGPDWAIVLLLRVFPSGHLDR